MDILYAALIFEGDVLTRVDDRDEYGERRFISIGLVDDRDEYGERRFISIGLVDDECFVVVHTPRQDMTRLITAWKGGRNDRTHYEAGSARRDQADEGSR